MLLLVNGLGSQSINYADDWCRMYAAHGLQVVRYDNRDVGLSSHLPGESYTLSDMPGDGIAVLDALGVDRAHVCGLSMGGMIVQTMAIEHPTRVITMTSVMSTTGEPEYGTASKEALAALLTSPEPTREGYVKNWFVGQRIWGSPAFADEARWRAAAEASFDRAFDPDGVGRQLRAVRSSPPRADALRSVTTPTLVIHGTEDRVLPVENGRRLASRIPGAELVILEGAGHAFHSERADEVNALVLDFLRRHRDA